MEDGVKEDPAKPKEMKLVGQAGWLKKASGKFLAGYKDRYIQLDKTQIAVYDNEDLKNCVERVDLENFDKCHELRSPFTKKHRLILTRVAKSGSKICDVKLQAQNQEDKDAWIKALNDGIIRAKNKIFDEVKLDQPSLEHVTRSRPKGNRGRRPPTRIHMKEVANVSSDGILRLDLSVTDSTPNGTHFLSADGVEEHGAPKTQEAPSKSPGDAPEEAQKKVLKPPMPPSKVTNPSESQESDTKPEDLAPQKKILMPSLPLSKEQQPSENQEEVMPSEEVQEKKVVKPPMPPSKENKPNTFVSGEKASDSGVESGAADSPSKSSLEPDNPDACKSLAVKSIHPPSPPSKDMKPKPALIIKDTEVILEIDENADDQNNEDVKDSSAQCQEEAEQESIVKTEDIAFTPLNNVPKPQKVIWDSSSSALEKDPIEQKADKSDCPDTAQSVVATVTTEPAKPYSEIKLTPCSTPEPVKKSTRPPAPPKKKPPKPAAKKEDSGGQCDHEVSTSSSHTPVVSPSVEGVSENVPADDIKPATHEPKGDHKVVILSLSNAGVGEDATELCGTEVEEKSVDSGQLSAEESENSDQVTSSVDKLEDSFQGLDAETSEDDLESLDTNVHGMEDAPSANLSAPPKGTAETFVSSPLPAAGPRAEISVPRSPSLMRAASMGNLLGEIGNVEAGTGEPDPGILLSTAMEKLQKTEQFLREPKSVKQLENKGNRTSW